MEIGDSIRRSDLYPIETDSSSEKSYIPQPETPMEPMEFLSRSLHVFSTHEPPMSQQQHPQQQAQVVMNVSHVHGVVGSIGKWFHHHHHHHHHSYEKKDKIRAEKAHIHAAVCVAELAASLASIASAEAGRLEDSRMNSAVASATQILATHCAELAESAGADHNLLVSVVQSATDVQTPSDLVTLTAAAATALRGEAALKARFTKESKKNASVLPYDHRGMGDHIHSEMTTRCSEHQCTEEMLQQIYNGGLHWKQVSVYINHRSQVVIKIKSSHVGGAFFTKHKGVVYGVSSELKDSWAFCTETENEDDTFFGVETAKGHLEFKCKSMMHKQKWVDAIRHLLQITSCDTTNISHLPMNIWQH
ncbi:VAN3-binding protein-like [Rutidosis leptorrhynchoides]|uniref:VAN3-binding protein-like n=1 Tax=Rutidosis leptorrhynchoides TaxID=125765 RepID=UPI003A99CC47